MRETDLVALVFDSLWWQVLGGGEGRGVECLHRLITFSGFPKSLPRPDGQLPLDQAWEPHLVRLGLILLSVNALLIQQGKDPRCQPLRQGSRNEVAA